MPDHRIFKYEIDLDKLRQYIYLPKDAQILSVQMQYGKCQAWAIVDVSVELVARTIRVLCTGASLTRIERLKHLGTVQNDGLVLHVFEESD